jgi:hypothetical protein
VTPSPSPGDRSFGAAINRYLKPHLVRSTFESCRAQAIRGMADRSDFQQQLNAMQNPVSWANALQFIAAQVAEKSL